MAMKRTGKKPLAKKKGKKPSVMTHYDKKVIFEGDDGKFYADQDCRSPADNLDMQYQAGWEIEKEFENQTGYPGLRKQYVLRRPNTDGQEPLNYILLA